MPIVALGFVVEPPTFDRTAAAPPASTPFHLALSTPIAWAIIACVPELPLRRNISVGSTHGVTPDWSPKPNTKYAPRALIDFSFEPAGAMNVIVWMGPRKS